MRAWWTTFVLFGVVFLAAPGFPCAGDEQPAELLVLSERKTELLEERLSAAAVRGFRLFGAIEGVAGFVKSNPLRLYLERQPDGSPRLEYRVVTGPFSGTLEKQVNRTAEEGFRINRTGILRKATPNPLGNPRSRQAETVVLIMERDGRGPPYEYKLLSPGTPKQFTRDVDRQTRQGFTLTGVRGFAGGWTLAVMQRPKVEQEFEPPARDAPPRYVVIDERKRDKLFQAVGDAASSGYRLFDTVRDGFVGGGDVVIMEQATVPGRPYSYYFLGTPPPTDLEARLNEGAEAGYRFLADLDPAMELIMERAPLEKVDVRYRTVTSEAAAGIEQGVADAVADGYGWAGLYGEVVVLGYQR
jgi:hypothetical protein